MPTYRVVLAIAALVGVASSALAAMFAAYEMIDLVNAKLGPDEQFDWIGSWRLWEARRAYRRFYPEGKLLSKMLKLQIAGLVFLIGAAWAFVPLVRLL